MFLAHKINLVRTVNIARGEKNVKRVRKYGQGCCKVVPPLSYQGGKGFIKMIGEFASSMSDVACALPSEQSQHGVVEHREHLRSMSHAQLRMIFAHGSIPSIMQSVFDSPM